MTENRPQRMQLPWLPQYRKEAGGDGRLPAEDAATAADATASAVEMLSDASVSLLTDGVAGGRTVSVHRIVVLLHSCRNRTQRRQTNYSSSSSITSRRAIRWSRWRLRGDIRRERKGSTLPSYGNF